MILEQPLAQRLREIVGDQHVAVPGAADLTDETESRGLRGSADLIVRPGTAEEVAAVVAACYSAGVAIVPRGGGTGFAGGAVPRGGVVLSLERLNRMRSFDPLLWRINVEAGVTTRARCGDSPVRAACSSRPIRAPPRVPDRREHRDQRRRPARVQVRRHGRLGDSGSRSSCRPAS